MSFDWIGFFDSRGEPYVLGPAKNVRSGHIGFGCPICGDDEDNHYSINLTTGQVRGCWRDSEHWMSPARLVATLSGTTMAAAIAEVDQGNVRTGASPRALLKQIDGMLNVGKPELGELPVMDWPFRAFKPFTAGGVTRKGGRSARRQRPYWDYLVNRGFKDPEGLSVKFGLSWCDTGDWSHRIIFPLNQGNRLVGWTARAIGYSKAKYKAHPAGDAMQNIVWQSRPVRTGDTIVIVEGLMDGYRMAGVPGVVVFAVLTNSAGSNKINQIIQAVRRARKGGGTSLVLILLDRKAESQAINLGKQLRLVDAQVGLLPEGVKDPGEFSHRQACVFIEKYF